MQLHTLDYSIIGVFFVSIIAIGLWYSKSSSKSSLSYFLGDRSMPWWLLGVSMVATTFSADTPNLVTDIVRKDGVSGNWVWWAFLLTGMLTVFVYARLWRRSGVLTDLEFYELRYSGKAATFLRAFRAVYLGVFFNVVIMAGVLLAGMKIAAILLGWSGQTTLIIVSAVVLIFSTFGGFKGVVVTDFVQFGLSMLGMIIAAVYIVRLPEVGGLDGLLSHQQVLPKTNMFPEWNDKEALITVFIIPIAVQWWNVWYPGAEPGGGGYIAQRMLSTKDEKGAIKATFLFNIAHYALRPWPWILIALASLIVFPTLESIGTAFPSLDKTLINDDLAFPAMLSLLPSGLVGLLIACLLAALLSTLSTHLNWGASYVVKDVYQRFVNTDATEKQLVNVGRIATVVLLLLSVLVAPQLESAKEAFDIMLKLGAGTGLIFILRWFWWRINAWSEVTAMIVPLFIILYFKYVNDYNLLGYKQLIVMILITTTAWLIVTFVTRPTDKKVLHSFYSLVKPHAFGWKPISRKMNVETSENSLGKEIILMVLGCVFVYSFLFMIGSLLYGNAMYSVVYILLTVGCGAFIVKQLR